MSRNFFLYPWLENTRESLKSETQILKLIMINNMSTMQSYCNLSQSSWTQASTPPTITTSTQVTTTLSTFSTSRRWSSVITIKQTKMFVKHFPFAHVKFQLPDLISSTPHPARPTPMVPFLTNHDCNLFLFHNSLHFVVASCIPPLGSHRASLARTFFQTFPG